eukprot:scaffold2550_cov153-Skeletonema_menzelii.AAC.12
MVESTPPPLPQSLSSRLQSSMDPLTGQCKFHPTVQLCELVQNNTRWVVRRKICYKCGSRPKGGGKHHMPGRCVSHVSRESRLIGEKTETSERGRQLRRSSSLMRSSSRSSMRSSSQSPADGRGRGRSESATRMTRSRSVSVGASSGRERFDYSSRNAVRSTSVSRERITHSVVEDVKKKEADKVKSSNHRHSMSMTAIESNERVKANNKATETNAHSVENKSSYRERALEFTQKAMEVTQDKAHSEAIVPRGNAEPDDHHDDTDDFDESDPVIMIPTIHLDDTSLPPPPPRTSEEMEVHEYRQELRRNHIRQQRRERSKSRNKLNADAAKQRTEEKKPSSTRRNNTIIVPTPKTEVRKSRRDRDVSKQSVSKPRKCPDSPTPVSPSPVHPSLAVLTALENHRQKVADEEPEITQVVSVDKQRQRRRRKSPDQEEKVVKINDSTELVSGDHDDEDAESETSSISSASAKHYQMQPESSNELRSRHPELKGVVSDPPQFPPVNVTVDRSRSRSRSRIKVGMDPIAASEEREMQLVVRKTSSRQLSSAHGNGARINKRPSKIEVEKKKDSVTSDNRKVAKHSSEGQLLKTSASSRSRPAQKKLVTSDAQTSKRTSRSYSGHVRGAEGKKLPGDRASKSAERSPSVAKSMPALMEEGKQRRCKSAATSRRGRSPHTSITQPESLSSDEFLKKSNTKEGPIVIYKKTATRRSRKEEHSSDDVKPMTAIQISEDEKSHASSISAGSRSTLAESFHSDCKGEDKIPADAREKAASVLKDVKGGAKNFAVKGKNALGGLKGTSKKWQSALFM